MKKRKIIVAGVMMAELAKGAEVLSGKALSIRGSNVANSESEVKEWASGF